MNGGSLKAEDGRHGTDRRGAEAAGTITVNMPTLAPFAAFVPTVANLDGHGHAEIVVGGTVAAPEITGNVDATRLQADLGNLGIELRDGRVRGEARSTAAASSSRRAWPRARATSSSRAPWMNAA